MFVTQAHSFAQQARLAITLAWVAGYTNILTILTCGHVTSHVSGTTSDLGRAAAQARWSLLGFSLFLLLTFFLGAALSGLTTELAKRRAWESVYVLPMILQTLLLTVFAVGVELHGFHADRLETGLSLYIMTGAASLAMGLQNATITRISSGVVRTTHVTGVLTDLGLESVQFLFSLADRPRPARLFSHLRDHPAAKRLALLASIIASFALGAALATLAYSAAPSYSMIPPVLFLLWIIYQDARKPIAEIQPSDLRDVALDLPPQLAVFSLSKNAAHTRSHRPQVHRFPNLTLWAERLPAAVRVVILDLADVAAVEPNSVLELHAVIARMHRQRRTLILAGVTPEQFASLARHAPDHADSHLDPLNLCPDLELAIARGHNVLHAAG